MKPNKPSRELPLRATMCATCPFRPGSPYAYLARKLAASAISEVSRICHSTGKNNAINKRTGFAPHICRGARDVQLNVMFSYRVLTSPTDAAWNQRREREGWQPIVIQDPPTTTF